MGHPHHEPAERDRLPLGTLASRASRLSRGEQFLLWALRQWQYEVAFWEAQQTLPAGGSALHHGFEAAGLLQALPHFAMVMDAVVCGVKQPIEIAPRAAPIVSSDEAVLLALYGLAQEGLEESLAACFSTMLPPESCVVAIAQLKLLADLLKDAGLGSMPGSCPSGRRMH